MLQSAVRLINRILGALRARWFFRKVTSLGRGVRLGTGAWVHNDGTIRIGRGVCFHPGLAGVELTTMFGGTLEIGDYTMVNYGCSFTASRLIRVGQRCRFGVGVILTDSNLHIEDPARRSLRPEPSTIVIEDDVWIAHRVIILPGVTLGKGSIVGAGSVVTRSIPAGVVAAGNPARIIRAIRHDDPEDQADVLKQVMSTGFASLACDHAELDQASPTPAVSGFHTKVAEDHAEVDARPRARER